MQKADDLPNKYAMFEEGWFTGLANVLDENSPHCSKTIEQSIDYYTRLVERLIEYKSKLAPSTKDIELLYKQLAQSNETLSQWIEKYK